MFLFKPTSTMYALAFLEAGIMGKFDNFNPFV